MLGISDNIENKVNKDSFDSLKSIRDSSTTKVLKRSTIIVCVSIFLFLFLPWTQNIRSKGYVTTLNPSDRPQDIQSIIPGQIKKWYVSEGDYVEKGDTILNITETKSEYFDPLLVERTANQINSKKEIIESYLQKIIALGNQTRAIVATKKLKVSQAKNYIKQAEFGIKSNMTDFNAATANFEIARKQYDRTENLFNDGLKSLTDLETKRLKVQETNAKLISAENKLLTSQNKLINSKMELASIENQYSDKLSKVESEKYSAISVMYDAEATLSKMKNQLSNYKFRKDQLYILAPQNAYITKAIVNGIGETVKEGQSLVTIMPASHNLAVEMYVKPADLPLIQKGQKVRFMFDGWPSIVLRGWPSASYGTFGGVVVAIDKFISDNGQYRLLVSADKEDEVEWPEGLRVGSGADAMVFLKDVSIGYEIWRNLNGFPPDYYKFEPNHNMSKAKKEKK